MFGFPGGQYTLSCGGGTPTAYTYNCGAVSPPEPNRVAYTGVTLDQRKRATAIVYVDMANARAAYPAQPVDVTLRARVGGRLLSGVLTQQRTDPPVSSTAWVTEAERGDPRYGLAFNVPAAWLASAALARETLTLEATAGLPPFAGSGLLTQCLLVVDGPNCGRDDSFTLTEIPVTDNLPELTVRSLPLLTAGQTVTGPGAIGGPDAVLERAIRIYPGGDRLTVLPYNGSVDIDLAAKSELSDARCVNFRTPPDVRGCRMAHVNLALDDWWRRDAQNRVGYNILLAVHSYGGEPGWKRGTTTVSDAGLLR